MQQVMASYEAWSAEQPAGAELIPVFYTSAYGNTAKLAKKIQEGILEAKPDADCQTYDIIEHDMAQLHALINHCKAFAVGSPTLNRDAVLKNNWVTGTNILYIGMTGSSLRRRIKQYMQFGEGKPVGHRGGCYIWQMEDCDRLIICWKELAEELPGEYETMLIRSFKDAHDGRRPFANRNN